MGKQVEIHELLEGDPFVVQFSLLDTNRSFVLFPNFMEKRSPVPLFEAWIFQNRDMVENILMMLNFLLFLLDNFEKW